MKIGCFSALALALGALVLQGCSRSSASIATAPPAPEVLVSSVVQKDVLIYGDWVATLDGYVNANIQPQVRVPDRAEISRRIVGTQGRHPV